MKDFANISTKLPPLKIGDLVARLPIIQGGMGVAISRSSLAGAVAAAGGVGVISTAQIGYDEEGWAQNPIETNLKAVARHITLAKEKARQGIVAVNIMVATRAYEKYVKAAVKAGVDLIISGAGLPVDLPEFVKGSAVKIAPIVSSAKAAKVICKLWERKSKRLPDLIVVEGPLAGGHLGFSAEELENIDMNAYDEEIQRILEVAGEYSQKAEQKIPVVIAGGIDDREKVRHCFELGADGVQVASRFVTTEECDAPMAYKQAYINAKKEDIVIVKSPVGMPGRAIKNAFIDAVSGGERFPVHCKCCLEKCEPAKIPYCITDALVNAAKGDVDHALLFCGAGAWKADRIQTVSEVLQELVE